MRVHVVYDSAFGNTELVALRIAQALARGHEVVTARVADADPAAVEAGDVLVVGSPTQGGRATPAIDRYLTNLPDSVLESVTYAAFDTRLDARWVRLFGYAADRIDAALRARDAEPLAAVGAFVVEGKEGPLRAGELERAETWAAALAVPVSH